MAWLGPVLGGVAQIGGALIGDSKRNAANEEAAKAQAAALKQWMDINVPTVADQQIFLEKLKSEGQLSPELEQAYAQQDSEMRNIAVDPRMKEAQLEALSSLKSISDSGGRTLMDRAAQEAAMSEAAQYEQGQRGALAQSMASRGLSGSGMEYAAQLANQQAGATRAHQAGMSAAAMAQARALEAIQQRGAMAGTMRSQEFGEQSQQAQAQDLINRFNTQNRTDVQQRNVAANNAGQLYNLGNAQRISDTNVGLSNQQQMHNKGLLQSQFQNQTQKAAGVAGQYNNQAAAQQKAGADAAAMWSGIGQGVGQMGAALYNGDPDKKKA